MARDIRDDLYELQEFLSGYSLAGQLEEREYRELLSRIHKPYLALLLVLSELSHREWQPLDGPTPETTKANRAFSLRVGEFASDVGSAFFVWTHGAYKNGRLSLRSAVENLVKAVGVVEQPDVVLLKSVYELFDVVGSLPSLALGAVQVRFQSLRTSYGELSRDVHTATEAEMEGVGSLQYFPRFSIGDAAEFAATFDRIVSTSLEFLLLRFPEVYRALHRSNADVVNVVLGVEARILLNRIERPD